MLHDTVRAAPMREPCFEPPPRLSVPPERRLSGRAVAAARAGGGMHGFRDNALTLVGQADGEVVATSVGAAVTAGFGLAAGRLCGASLTPETGTLAECLATAFERARQSAAVTGFEAAVATPFAACVLLRGVMLPTATGAEAVLSWKQVLDADATARIRAELMREMRPPARRRTAADAFA